MAVLPTGFGKSLIYQIIPKVLKNESDDTQKFIVCVVSPLEYNRKQQVESINKLHGLSAAAAGDNEETDKDIEDGGVNIVFGSTEQYLSDKWKKALQFGSLHEAEVLVVDEVHTVETWYGAFRPFFMPIKSSCVIRVQGCLLKCSRLSIKVVLSEISTEHELFCCTYLHLKASGKCFKWTDCLSLIAFYS